MILCEMFLREILRNTNITSVLGSCRSIVDGCGDAIWQLW